MTGKKIDIIRCLFLKKIDLKLKQYFNITKF
jgi:hypothetical protein